MPNSNKRRTSSAGSCGSGRKAKLKYNVVDEAVLNFNEEVNIPINRTISAIEPIILSAQENNYDSGSSIDFNLPSDQWLLFTDSTKIFCNISISKATVTNGTIDNDSWTNCVEADIPKIFLFQNFLSKLFSSVQFLRNMVIEQLS